jgi:hypothetical protein
MNPANVKAACPLTPHPPHSKTWRSLVASLVVLPKAGGWREASWSAVTGGEQGWLR